MVPIHKNGAKDSCSEEMFTSLIHAGYFSHVEVHFFQKFVSGKFIGTYAVESELQQSPNIQWEDDTAGATLTLYLYKLMNINADGIRGVDRYIYFDFVKAVHASKITGNPSTLKKDFESLISKY